MYLPTKAPVSHSNVSSLSKGLNDLHKVLEEGGSELSPIEIFKKGIVVEREIER